MEVKRKRKFVVLRMKDIEVMKEIGKWQVYIVGFNLNDLVEIL